MTHVNIFSPIILAGQVQSTYRHDFTAPEVNRYRFLKKDTEKESDGHPCTCRQPKTDTTAVVQTHSKAEWTGIAPMGKLIDPRIIPEATFEDEEKVSPCQKDQPNRFLKCLRGNYPDLYEKLKAMPQNELQQQLDKDRLRSTYQVDYSGMSEHPQGLYPEQKDERRRGPALSLLTDGCENFRGKKETSATRNSGKRKEQNEVTFKPPDLGGNTSGGGGGGAGGGGAGGGGGGHSGTGHWEVNPSYNKKPRISEYMDVLSRNGCAIITSKIHDHSRCVKGKNCHHVVTLCKNPTI